MVGGNPRNAGELSLFLGHAHFLKYRRAITSVRGRSLGSDAGEELLQRGPSNVFLTLCTAEAQQGHFPLLSL